MIFRDFHFSLKSINPAPDKIILMEIAVEIIVSFSSYGTVVPHLCHSIGGTGKSDRFGGPWQSGSCTCAGLAWLSKMGTLR